MAIVDLVMPKMGESIMEATILKWHKNVGDFIKQDEIVLDIATDKVDSEIPSNVEGILKEILYYVNDIVPVGTVLAKIEISAAADHKVVAPVQEAPAVVPVVAPATVAPVVEPTVDYVPFTPSTTANKVANNNRFFSPLVLNIANSEGLSLSELENVPGTGAENRVTKKDILQYIADKKAGKVQPVVAQPQYAYVAPTPAPAAVAEVAPVVEVAPVAEVVKEVAEPVAVPEIAPIVEVAEVAAVAAATVAVAEHFAPAPVEVAPVADDIDTSEFIKQEVALPIIETPAIEEETVAETIEEAPVYQSFKIDDAPVAIPSIEETVYVAPAVEPIIEEAVVTPPVSILSVEETVYVAPVQPIHVSPVVETVHTAPVNVHVESAPVVAAPAVQAAEVKAQEAYRVSYEEHIKETVQPANNNYTNNITPTQNIMSEAKPSVEIIEMDRMRKLIAKHMVDSKHTSPHVTSFAEADVTNMVQWRERVKGDFEKREGIKLTYTPMFIECILKVLKRYPLINSSVDGDKILIKNFFNIGFATSLPSGNLIVPVIKDAQNHNLISLTRSVSTLAENARNNKLKPDDTTGGTFTFSNLGNFGSLMGTPIINQPQSAIMAVGAIKKRPVVIETDKGDFIGIRQMMYLSLSYDHRIIDGSVGASFLTEVAKEFENWNLDRELKYVVKEWYVE